MSSWEDQRRSGEPSAAMRYTSDPPPEPAETGNAPIGTELGVVGTGPAGFWPAEEEVGTAGIAINIVGAEDAPAPARFSPIPAA